MNVAEVEKTSYVYALSVARETNITICKAHLSLEDRLVQKKDTAMCSKVKFCISEGKQKESGESIIYLPA